MAPRGHRPALLTTASQNAQYHNPMLQYLTRVTLRYDLLVSYKRLRFRPLVHIAQTEEASLV